MEEEAKTNKTKASDSAYSKSSTSQYQRSDGSSSKSRRSNSSGSSGYCGQPSVLSSRNDDDGFPQPQTCTKRKKRKQHKQAAMESSGSAFWDGSASTVATPVAAAPCAAPDAVFAQPSLGGGATVVLSAPLAAETASEVTSAVGPQEGESDAGVDGGEKGNEALQMAALSHTLHCMKRTKDKEECQGSNLKCGLHGENGVGTSAVNGGAMDSKMKEHLDSYLSREDACSPHDEGEGFVVVVSMEDGTVVHTTPRSLTASLGFPSGMWHGRDFIDFVHPKDRMSFASHITSGVARGEDSFLKGLPTKTSIYCSLRQYRGLRNVGYGVTRKRVPYLPFRLTFTFREMNLPQMEMECVKEESEKASEELSRVPNAVSPRLESSTTFPMRSSQEKCFGDVPLQKESEEMNRSVFIVITATRIFSAYKVPNEEITPGLLPSPEKTLQSPGDVCQSLLRAPPHLPDGVGVPTGKFVTRHLASCHLIHVDPLAVPYLGYLPQDMEGRSVMDFYHPDDMPILKEAYINVMRQPSSPFKGKHYRFRTQNGCYILVETEWSSFVNPWSRKLEFVIGQHHILKGPSNPRVFSEPNEEDCHQFPDEVVKETEAIQKEIILMLDQKVTRVSESARQQVSKRCRDLAFFMETLMDEMAKPAHPLRVELPTQDGHYFSERDSVMLGEISPHHDYYDGKSSTETPPSYNQLNYNENLQRFFESKPKTTLSDESADINKMEGSCVGANNQSPLSTDEEGKGFPNVMDSSSASGGERKNSSQANESESGGSVIRQRGGWREAVGPEWEGVLCYREEDGTTGGSGEGGKPAISVSNKAKFRGNRGSALNVEAGNQKGNQPALLSGGQAGRRATGQPHLPHGVYQGQHLTEALLSRHNEDMEKIMVQKHREQRSMDREGKIKDGRKSNHDKAQEHVMHGVKRSGSFEGDRQRVKHQLIEQPPPQQSHGHIVGTHSEWPAEHHRPMAVTVPPPSAGNTLAPVPSLPNSNAIAAAAMASSSMVQKGSGLRVAVFDHPSTPIPQLWPPLSVTMTPVNNGCLTYSYPGMMMVTPPPPKHPSPATAPPNDPLADQLPSSIDPHLIDQRMHPLVQPFPIPHLINHHGSMIYYVPAGSTGGVLPVQVSKDNSGAQPHVVGFPHRQVPVPTIPGYPLLMPVNQARTTDIPSMTGNSCITNNSPIQSNGMAQVLYPAVNGPAQMNGSSSTQQLFLPSLNAAPVPPLLSPACHPPSTHPPLPNLPSQHAASSEIPILQRAPATSAPPSATCQFLQRVRRSGTRTNPLHHNHFLHHMRLQEQAAIGRTPDSIKGIPLPGSLLRSRDGMGMFLVADREALSSTTVLNAKTSGAASEMEDDRDKAGSPLVFPKYQRPSSQATSIKAEPGSAVGSVASASRLRELLEVSKKCKSIGSSGRSKGNRNCEDEDEDGYYAGRDRKISTSEIAGNDHWNGDLTKTNNLLQDPETICDDSSYSSLYSFLRTDKSDESLRSSAWGGRGHEDSSRCNDAMGKTKSWGPEARMRNAIGEIGPKSMRKGPAWLEEVDVTPDLIFRYKMDDQILRNVLESDRKTLKTISQSSTVNEQLSQLYMDMELEGAPNKWSLEDSGGFTSSSGTDDAPLNGINMSPSRITSKSKKKRRSTDYGKLVMIFEENAPFPPPPIST